MKKFLFGLASLLFIIAIVIMSVNSVNISQYWLLVLKNQSLFEILFFMFFIGFLTGIFLMLAVKSKKENRSDF